MVHQKVWTRNFEEFGKKHDRHNKPFKEKESYRWLETVKVIDNLQLKPKLIVIGDRKSDIAELFMEKFSSNINLLVRVTSRRIIDQTKIQDYLANQPFKIVSVTLPKAHQEQERQIDLKLHYVKSLLGLRKFIALLARKVLKCRSNIMKL